jgi:hypothetical protein
MDSGEAKRILGQVNRTVPMKEWNSELTTAVQQALAQPYLLNPYDDVDGKLGPRTQQAWKFFKEATGQGNPDIIDAKSAGKLIEALDNPHGLIGQAKIDLLSDFEFRRSQREANRDRSVSALIEAAKARHLIKSQIAYILATAEHETDSFNTLEEYLSGDEYEYREDLGNSQPGDGPRFKGRGYVQLTGRSNYGRYTDITSIELLKLPIILMNWPALSVFVMIDGMVGGVYTGKRLDEFLNSSKQDFYNARQVVNGHKAAEEIADQASDWLKQIT